MAEFLKKSEYVQMSMPKAMNRTNPAPLDASAVWTSLEELKNYAATNPVAYVGQILSLVAYDEESQAITNVKAYIIKDAEGNIEEVGSATLGDDKTITLDNGVLSLKNWNKKYFKRDPENEGEYIEVTVDASNPWQAGLQPRAYFDGSNYVLAWYEPSTQTIEGVDAAVGALTTTVQGITNTIGDKETAAEGTVYGDLKAATEAAAAADEKAQAAQDALADYLPLAGGTMTGDIILSDSSKAASEKVVDTKIATAIGSAGHLKRAIVDALPAIEEADADTIYMVKDVLALEGDKYEEFMAIEGEWAQIGDTSVDLTNYVQKVAEATKGNLAALNADGALIDAGILGQDVKDHLANTDIHITADERTAWNEGAAQAATNAEAIENLVKISQDDADKLAALPGIKSIGDNLELGEDGVLKAIMPEGYTLPAATADTLGGVKVGSGLAIDEEGVLSVPVVAANGLAIGNDGLTLALASADAAGAMSKEDFVKLSNLPVNAQANVIEGALLGANQIAAEISNKQLILPLASADKPGLVASSTADNAIAVHAATGVMTINRVSTSKLFIPDGEELVLNGGKA